MGKRPAERYEPLPGVLQLPGWLIGKLTPRGRKIFWTGAALTGAALIAAVIILAPRISQGKQDRAARDKREAAAATARERRQIRAEQTPHSGTAGRRGLTRGLETAIVADVARRVRTHELKNPVVRTDCSTIGHLRQGGARLTAFDCTAVITVIPKTAGNGGGVSGYPYRALGDPRRGRFTFCKISGRAGEGQLTSDRTAVPIPKACVG